MRPRGVFSRFEDERRAERSLEKAVGHVARTKVVLVGERSQSDPATAPSSNAAGKFILGYSKLGGADVLG